MFYSDYHVHTNFSGDSNTPPETMIQKAIDLGLEKICITDHYDADFPNEDISFVFDVDTYFKKLKYLKEKHSKKIEILIGVELGLQPDLTDIYTKLLNDYPFDFVIGSSHLIDKIDPYRGRYYENKTEYNAYSYYLKSIINNIKAFSSFQVYGHLDYIVRYGPYENKLITCDSYKEILDKLLLSLIHLGKGIEINSSGLKYGLGFPHPNLQIIKRYRELGGEIITIGSDAHVPEHLCYDFKIIYSLLKDIGFKYYTIFVNQKPEFIKIP
ncbi:MAG: histidinol-phosphatase HisJ family protein [Eubacteriales bacterium]